MNTKQEKDIIRTLVKAGHESLAKTFARSRGYGVKKSKRVRAQTFDPRKAVVYFELVAEEDAEGDEMAALKELQKILKVRKIENEGHDRYDALVCRISDVHSTGDVKKLFQRIDRAKGGGDDIIYVDGFAAQQFRLLPEGVNGPQIPTEDIDEFLEEVE